jgi:hypothetical protein
MQKSKPQWISSRLCCGLGNRLFQITAAIGAAEKASTRPVLFLPAMQKVEHGNFELLRTLCPSLELIYTAPEWDIVSESQQATVPLVLPTATDKPIVLQGFFQNTDNFPSLTNNLLPRLPSSPLTPSPDLWAVHFRFGDYLILPHHQVPGLSKYYYHAITTYVPKGTSLRLFSDNPELLAPIAEEIRNLGYSPEIFTDPDTLATLHAFASCTAGAICSNSTFAWWAAFFTAQQQKASTSYKAFFPDTWLRDQPPPPLASSKLPFTQFLRLQDIPSAPSLTSFRF